MEPISQIISTNIKELFQFLKSNDFSKAVLIGIAITLPIVFGLVFNQLEIGLAIGFGAFWCSPSHVSGKLTHKINGILLSALLIMIVSFLGGYLHYQTWLIIPVLGFLTFSIAFISVYGFRASLISFSGLLALVLSFAHISETLEMYEYAFLIGLGGLWYLLLVVIWYFINPKAHTEEILAETFLLTAAFLETRGKLVGPQPNRDELQAKLLDLQAELVERHATLREILIQSRKKSGLSHYKGKRLLVFVQLVEILEAAIANPVNYDKMDVFLKYHPNYVKSFQDFIFEVAKQLKSISKTRYNKRQLPNNKQLILYLERLEQEVEALKNSNNKSDYEGFLILQNYLEYQKRQFLKIKRIKWLLGNPNMDTKDFIDSNESKRFIVSQDYSLNILLRNLSFKSNIFKHSLRLAVTVVLGYILGHVFAFQNPYWILLTIIVIMRPSYGLTKVRSKDRIIGTLIGGAVAAGMVLLIQNPYLYAVLGIGSLIIAFSMVQRNYKASATFITLSVVFIYGIIEPDISTVIQYRIIDTVLGAALSYVAMLFLWPAWSFLDIHETIEMSVQANKDFLNEIGLYYEQKGQVPTSYKVARKTAFLETSNLNSAFQRMAQEPKSKQKHLDKIYELVELNHTFLSSLASLSTYIQNHPTTEASEMFKEATHKIDNYLSLVLKTLQKEVPEELAHLVQKALSENEQLINDMIFLNPKDKHLERQYQEFHLVWEQLQWLYAISRNMLKITSSIKIN
ncbi:putative membrane protein [Xanthomarina gelatinilytica]|uniref:Putative membrane protein n=1 Tax=Xanthomarina gelatinilytica TaxID=1137281 RepID=M7MXV0_9FLAO|nr:FUSC family membrane protein [Xanthomarina gelatinilytica]EMQ94289.1 putative membrane protein [Xanthomarina gelatinilytica]